LAINGNSRIWSGVIPEAFLELVYGDLIAESVLVDQSVDLRFQLAYSVRPRLHFQSCQSVSLSDRSSGNVLEQSPQVGPTIFVSLILELPKLAIVVIELPEYSERHARSIDPIVRP
jgi:hypothetical protein